MNSSTDAKSHSQDWIKEEIDNWMKNPDISTEKILNVYGEKAELYNDEQIYVRYRGIDILFGHLKPFIETQQGFTLLDVGAGTGLLGAKLRPLIDESQGKLDALDPSEKMLKVAPAGTYDREFHEFVTGLNSTSLPNDYYDGACSTGAFVPAHIPPEGIKELLRVTKIGGIVAVLLRTKYMSPGISHENLIPLVRNLETKGLCRIIKISEIENFFEDLTGTIIMLEKLQNF